MKSEERFSDRVDDYVRARPGYPLELIEALRREVGLTPGDAIAELGSGTGILTRLLLDYGCTVYAVEPNAEMAGAARRALGCFQRFVDVRASAEDTGLPAQSVAGVIAAQAFHWFDVDRARAEVQRLLRPGGWAALVWNMRRSGGTPFLEEYERLLRTYPDYARVSHGWAEPTAIARFFGREPARITLANAQRLDADSLVARAQSSSYVPKSDAVRAALLDLHARHARDDGTVEMTYDTELFVGRL